MKKSIIVLLLLSSWTVTEANAMTQDEMEKTVTDIVKVDEANKGYVVFEHKNVKMALISDVDHDRMRIIAPITKYSDITLEQVKKVMESNFHKALDARYAESNDVLYSAFIHPLSPLTEKEIIKALDQVATLALTFGTSYSSGELSYGGKE